LSGLKFLLKLGEYLFIYLACGIAGDTGAVVYFLAGCQLWSAIAAAWIVLAASAAALVPLAAVLFRRFDVASTRPT
jgi:hypothetical protein